MKLEYLKLSNFRGFRELEITFDPSFTVLLGGNMAGKSAVLDGAALMLRRMLGSTQARDIEDDEVRQIVSSTGGVPELQRQFPVVVHVKVAVETFAGGAAEWALVREGLDEPTRGAAYTVLNAPLNKDLPVIAHYGAQRHWNPKLAADDLRGIGSRYDGYAGAFDVRSTHGVMAGWMRKQTLVQLQKGNAYVQPQLAAVTEAVKSCIEQIKRFWFDVQYDELRLERSNGDILSFAMLSEGYRNMVAMIADIAWRASVLNPHHGSSAHLCVNGIVLIDELDLHLHPAWQRRVIDDLRRTFPRVQFVVTTHSPQIVASVSRSQVRLLEDNRLVADDIHVEGRDSNAILEDVFDVASRPERVQTEIDALFRSIEDEAFETAREQLARLLERLGPDDPAIIRARWMLDLDDPQPHARPPSAA